MKNCFFILTNFMLLIANFFMLLNFYCFLDINEVISLTSNKYIVNSKYIEYIRNENKPNKENLNNFNNESVEKIYKINKLSLSYKFINQLEKIYVIPISKYVYNGNTLVRNGYYSSAEIPVSVKKFGAKGDGKTDDRLAIQKAMDSGESVIVIPKGTFLVSLNPTLKTPEGGTGIAINIPSNKTIYIEGKLLLKPGTIGNSSAILGNTEPVKNVKIIGKNGGIIDGNRLKVKGQIINICLWNAINCVYESISSINSSFIGLSFRGTVPGYGNNKMIKCRINNITYIGVQVAKPSLGFIIDHCQIRNCGDNGIDIEGNNPNGDPGFGKNIFVRNCIIEQVANGVFLESVGGVTLTNTTINKAVANSVYINRINSGSFGNKIINNTFKNTPKGTGVNFNGYVGETNVSNNYFENFKQSIYLNGGATDVTVGSNKHKKIARYLVKINRLNNSAVKCTITQQTLIDGQRNGFPETTTPINNTANMSNRMYLTAVKPAYSLQSRSLLPGTFIRAKTNTYNNSNWGGYSTYYKGETIQYFPNDPPKVGEYVKINGTVFYVSANSRAGEYVLQNPKGKNDDFTITTNGKYSVIIYWPDWMEQ